jgi:hypothetical protein
MRPLEPLQCSSQVQSRQELHDFELFVSNWNTGIPSLLPARFSYICGLCFQRFVTSIATDLVGLYPLERWDLFDYSVSHLASFWSAQDLEENVTLIMKPSRNCPQTNCIFMIMSSLAHCLQSWETLSYYVRNRISVVRGRVPYHYDSPIHAFQSDRYIVFGW